MTRDEHERYLALMTNARRCRLLAANERDEEERLELLRDARASLAIAFRMVA